MNGSDNCLENVMGRSTDEKEREDLRQAGLKITYPRLKILDLFQKQEQKHLSADEVYKRLLDAQEDIGLATVYRVIGQLEATGLIKKSHIFPGKAVYELAEGGHHDHLVCMDCGRLIEFHDDVLEAKQECLSDDLGFVLQRHSLAIFCHCTKKECEYRNQ